MVSADEARAIRFNALISSLSLHNLYVVNRLRSVVARSSDVRSVRHHTALSSSNFHDSSAGLATYVARYGGIGSVRLEMRIYESIGLEKRSTFPSVATTLPASEERECGREGKGISQLEDSVSAWQRPCYLRIILAHRPTIFLLFLYPRSASCLHLCSARLGSARLGSARSLRSVLFRVHRLCLIDLCPRDRAMRAIVAIGETLGIVSRVRLRAILQMLSYPNVVREKEKRKKKKIRISARSSTRTVLFAATMK